MYDILIEVINHMMIKVELWEGKNYQVDLRMNTCDIRMNLINRLKKMDAI